MGFSAPAQAQTEVWSGTLTVKQLGGNIVGCSNTIMGDYCSDTSNLTDDDFTYDSTDYEVNGLFLRSNGQLQLHFTTDLATAAQTLTLDVDGTTFAFEDAHVKGARQRHWSSSGLSWSAGDTVALKLTGAPTVPGAPVLTATANGATQIDLSWTVPDTGGSDITRYNIEVSTDGGTSWVGLIGLLGAATTTYSHTGLSAGTTYHYRVAAVNAIGAGAPSNVDSATTEAAGNNAPEFTDGANTTRSVAENTASSRNIGTAVAATDADSGDTLRYTLGGTDMASFAIVSTSGQLQTRAALDFETKSSYAVTVSVSDGNGGSDSIGVTITVTDVAEKPATPGAPTVSATANSDTSLDVSWTAPGLNGGPALTGYNLQYRQGTTGSFTNGPQNVSGTSTAITGLTAGTSYQVQVRALNGETPSDWSPAGTGSTSSATAPEVPRTLAAAPGDGQVVLTWTVPANTVSAILRYEYRSKATSSLPFVSSDSWASAGTSTTATVGSLTNATPYSFQVRAVNTVGAGPAATTSATPLATARATNPTLTLDVAPTRFGEAAGSARICVVPSAPSTQRITVQAATADGTATAPGDYRAYSSTVALQPQQQRACFTVTLVDDAEVEGDETFTVTLSNPVNATLGARAVATFTIVDNENVAPTFTEGTSTTRSVAENTRAGQNIGTRIVATDADSGDTLEYTLGGTDFKSFGIHLNTGQLLTQAALDFETKSSYAVSISVSDGNGGTDSIEVAITVTDVDESGGGGGDDGDDGDDRPRTSAPGAVRDLTVAGGDGQVVLTWDAPASDGGAAITDYEYRYRTGGSYGAWISTGSTETTHTVTGLVNGAAYTFQVRAVNRVGKGRTSNRADAAPGGGLGFAHFANGAAITSDLVFVNVAPQPVQPAIYFYDTEGNPMAAESVVDITGDLAVAEDGALTVLTAMEPLGELTIATHGRGDLVSGSVRAVAGGPIGGVLRFDLPGVGVAGVGASQPVRDALFPVRRQKGGINTGVAIHNLEEEAIVVSCRLMSEGTVLETAEIPLAANGQTSWFIDAAFPGTDTSDFAGSVHCDAPGRRPFAGVAVELDAVNRIFTTLPVVSADRTSGGREAALGFAHFANGAGLTSDLVIVNRKTQPSGPAPTPFHTAIPPIRPAIYFYDTEGALVSAESVVDITGDLAVAEDGALTVLTEMEPLGVVTISTHGRGDLVTGSVKVVSEGPVGGMLRFDLPGVGVAGVGTSQPVSDAIFPVRRQEGGINTGVAIHNLESSPEIVRCELMREGVLRDAVPIPLAANGQVSWFIDEMFPATDTSDFTGSVRCTVPDGGSFAGVAVELDAANRIFTTLPVVPVPERPDQE